MSQQNVQIVRTGVRAWMSGDVDALFANWDDEIEWIPPPEDPDYAVAVGVAAAREAMARWISTWDEYRYEPGELIDAGDEVIQTGRQVMVARGAEVSSEVCFVLTMRGGRAARLRMFYSRDEALAAAGLTD